MVCIGDLSPDNVVPIAQFVQFSGHVLYISQGLYELNEVVMKAPPETYRRPERLIEILDMNESC